MVQRPSSLCEPHHTSLKHALALAEAGSGFRWTIPDRGSPRSGRRRAFRFWIWLVAAVRGGGGLGAYGPEAIPRRPALGRREISGTPNSYLHYLNVIKNAATPRKPSGFGRNVVQASFYAQAWLTSLRYLVNGQLSTSVHVLIRVMALALGEVYHR
jgi:hypothetical protein